MMKLSSFPPPPRPTAQSPSPTHFGACGKLCMVYEGAPGTGMSACATSWMRWTSSRAPVLPSSSLAPPFLANLPSTWHSMSMASSISAYWMKLRSGLKLLYKQIYRLKLWAMLGGFSAANLNGPVISLTLFVCISHKRPLLKIYFSATTTLTATPPQHHTAPAFTLMIFPSGPHPTTSSQAHQVLSVTHRIHKLACHLHSSRALHHCFHTCCPPAVTIRLVTHKLSTSSLVSTEALTVPGTIKQAPK